MSYARVTSVAFPQENVTEGLKILEELNDAASKGDGHILGMIFRSVVDPAKFLRVSLWVDRKHSDDTSSTEHVVALRSRLNNLSLEGGHVEESYEYLGDAGKLPGLNA